MVPARTEAARASAVAARSGHTVGGTTRVVGRTGEYADDAGSGTSAWRHPDAAAPHPGPPRVHGEHSQTAGRGMSLEIVFLMRSVLEALDGSHDSEHLSVRFHSVWTVCFVICI